jgi:hypothetical protein
MAKHAGYIRDAADGLVQALKPAALPAAAAPRPATPFRVAIQDAIQGARMTAHVPTPRAPGTPWLPQAGRRAYAGAGAAALAYGAYKALRSGADVSHQVQDFGRARTEDMSTPYTPMTVLASYDEFAEAQLGTKLADFNGSPAPSFAPTLQNAGNNALAQSLAQSLISKPLDGLGGLLKKKFYDGPKQRQTFDHVMGSDPELHGADRGKLEEAFGSLKRFGPSMAMDRNATRTFLRQAMMSGGNLDFATLRMLSEIEKFHQGGKQASLIEALSTKIAAAQAMFGADKLAYEVFRLQGLPVPTEPTLEAHVAALATKVSQDLERQAAVAEAVAELGA